MPALSSHLRFLRGRTAALVSLVLIAQAGLFYALPRAERVPSARPLREFAGILGPWRIVQENQVEKEIAEELKANDLLSRIYSRPGAGAVSLFIAFFKSQRTGVVPHSPKHCLPASGWVPRESAIVSLQVPGAPDPIRVNRYIVSRWDNKSVVLYWYQTPKRVIASEYSAKVYLVLDGFRYRRSDTSMVRVVVPVQESEEAAEKVAVDFVRELFSPLRRHLPG